MLRLMFFSLDELIHASQQSDLNAEAERLKREKAETAAWLAKVKAPNTYNATQLLEKLTGGTAEAAPALQAPKPVVERKTTDARFPPPPTSK